MAEQGIELTFTAEELHLLWDALTHKERYHRAFWATLETSDSESRQRALDINSHILTKVQELSDILEQAMQRLEPQQPLDGPS